MYAIIFCFMQKTAYDMRISDWSSDVCSSDLADRTVRWRCIRSPGKWLAIEGVDIAGMTLSTPEGLFVAKISFCPRSCGWPRRDQPSLPCRQRRYERNFSRLDRKSTRLNSSH